MRNLDKLLKGEHILGLANVSFEKNRVCNACQAGKQVGVPHRPKTIITTRRPIKLLHMDLFLPVAYISIGGNKYGFVIVGNFFNIWSFTLHWFTREDAECVPDHRTIRHRELLEAHQAVDFSFVPAADAAGTSMTKGDWTLKPKRERK